jgi:hypothetical protein
MEPEALAVDDEADIRADFAVRPEREGFIDDGIASSKSQ